VSDQLHLQFWDFENAPANLRRAVPLPYMGGWVGFIPPGRPSEVAEVVLAFLNLSGFAFICCGMRDGCIILAGPHLAGAGVRPSEIGSGPLNSECR
jgi:hypothetical protein